MKAPPFQVAAVEEFDPELERFTFPAYRGFLKGLQTGKSLVEGQGIPMAWCATAGKRRVGMVLVGIGIKEAGTMAQFLSLYVLPSHRNRGIARALWTTAEQALQACGHPKLLVKYVTGKPCIPYLERILDASGWSEPETNMLVIHMCMTRACKASWYREWKLPAGYTLVDWVNLDAESRSQLKDWNARDGWIAPDLIPFDHEPDCHAATSLALLKEGAVVGWLINHLVKGVLRYTCSFAHPDLQRRGCVFWLYSESMRRMVQLGIERGMWTIPKHHPSMQAFARKWMQPHSDRFEESLVRTRIFP